jgi:hypothetical protein
MGDVIMNPHAWLAGVQWFLVIWESAAVRMVFWILEEFYTRDDGRSPRRR